MSRIAGRWLGVGLILLGTGIAAAAVLGPLVLGVLVYRTSPTTLHQIAGGDAALCVVAPATVAVGLLALRRDIVVPAAVAVGVGLLRDRAWAVKPMYAIVGGYTLLGASVTGMAVTMTLRGDPEASAATLAGSALVTVALAAFCVVLYGPLVRPPGSPDRRCRRNPASCPEEGEPDDG
jgi:hypothetical protein